MTLTMGWLGRARQKRRIGEPDNVMRQPRAMLVVGIVCTGFFLALAILSQVFPGSDGHGHLLKEAAPGPTLVFLAFAALSAVVIAAYFRESHRVEAEELHYRTLTKEGTLWWRSVKRVRYSASMKWFKLEKEDGEIIRVSVAVTGLPVFAQAVLEKVPPAALDDFTRDILMATAQGHPPSMWR